MHANSLSQSGKIDIEEESSRVTGKFLALVICVPVAVILVVSGIVLFTIYFRKKDRKAHFTGDYGSRNDIY